MHFMKSQSLLREARHAADRERAEEVAGLRLLHHSQLERAATRSADAIACANAAAAALQACQLQLQVFLSAFCTIILAINKCVQPLEGNHGQE